MELTRICFFPTRIGTTTYQVNLNLLAHQVHKYLDYIVPAMNMLKFTVISFTNSVNMNVPQHVLLTEN